MYTEALAEKSIICSERMVLKLGIVLMAIAVFSGQGMRLQANEGIIQNYVRENIMEKEQTNALFLLKENWEKELKIKYSNNKIKEVAEGIVYINLIKTVNKRRIKVNVAEINRNINPEIEIIPKMSSSKLHTRGRINNIAKDAKIAVNGTYFKQDTGTPLGALVINNEIITGPIYERVALGIKEKGFTSSRVSFEGYIEKNGEKLSINNINQPRMLSSYVLIYTDVWGEKSPANRKHLRQIAVKNNKVIDVSNFPLAIPKGGYVISAPIDKLKKFKTGDEVRISYKINPDMDGVNHIISGGPYLLKDGSVFVDTTSEKLNSIAGRNPRTAIGYTRDNVMIMVTVDGRKEGSSGVTLFELARIMKELGCYEAINLDGGSSTVMYVDGRILAGSSIKNSASISNALTVRIKA